MADYDFSTINSSDFEKLACDLLNREAFNKEQNIKFSLFKEGKDRGIDLLHSSSSNTYEIVVQVKHYIKSSYSTLKSKLINEEKRKVEAIRPSRYIIVTSQPLSLVNKVEIKKIFTPFIHSLDDIYGKEDLNVLLGQNTDIEENHFKLWFSSVTALRNIMEYKYKGRSNDFQEHTLKKRIRLFVKTSQVDQAEKILEKNKFLIITGDPGVGKTTLSDILVYKYISKGYKLGLILDSIRELEEMIRDDDSKQIFYYDDFLGHTQAEIEKSKEAESFLLRQISRIENGSNKYLILNTRKFILNSMITESERFRRFNPFRAESKLELTAYTYGAKRRMLDNHIIESELSDGHKKVISQHAYHICSHNNFSPRLIEFFCSKEYIKDFSEKELSLFIQSNLANPKDIWEHAYWHQISDYDRLLINTLFSLRSRAQQARLEEAFNKRLDYEVKSNNFKKPFKAFQNSLSKLNGGFIDIFPTGATNRINFVNPSLEDFLNHSILENNIEIERILYSASSFRQWLTIFKPFKSHRHAVQPHLINHLKENYLFLQEAKWDTTYKYNIAIFFYYFEPYSDITSFNILSSIDYLNFSSDDDIPYHLNFLDLISSVSKFRELISEFPISFFLSTLFSIKDVSEIENTMLLLRRFGFSLIEMLHEIDEFSSTYNELVNLKEHFQNIFEDEVEYQYQLLVKIIDTDAHIDILETLDISYNLIVKYVNPDFEINFNHLVLKDWNEVALNNRIEREIFGDPITPENYDEIFNDYNYDEYGSEYNQDFERYQLGINKIIEQQIGESDDLPF